MNRAMGPYAWAYWIMISCNVISPQIFWWKKARTSIPILFVVSIYQGQQKGQHFGMIENAFIRAVDARGREMARFNVSGDAAFNQKRSVVFAEVYRRDGGWKFRAIGTPHDTDSFVDILRSYVR